MVYTPIVIGSLNWGAPVNNAFTSQDARITELESQGGATVAALGFSAMTFDPSDLTASQVLTSGLVLMVRLDITAPMTITNIITLVTAAGVTLTAGQNFAGLYDSVGTRVGVTADQTTAWGTTGDKTMALTAPYAAAAGTYYVAYLSNGATPVALARKTMLATATTFYSFGLTTATARFATGPAAQTTLPASITMASRTQVAFPMFAGVN